MHATRSTSVASTAVTDTVPAERPRPRRRASRLAALATMVLASIGVGLAATPGTADAAAYRNQWVWFEGNNTDRDYEFTVYYDAYGRATLAYADVNNNGRWDASTALVNGQARGWLFDVDEVGGWDALVTSNGTTYSNIGGCGAAPTSGVVGGGYYSSGTTVRYHDTVYGVAWCSMSSALTGRISAPNLTGNYLYTLSTLSKLAPSLHCSNYAAYYWPSTGRCHTSPRA